MTPDPELALSTTAADPDDAEPGATRTVPRRRRRHERGEHHEGRPRPHRLTPRFSDIELDDIKVAAALAGMTPTGYVAKCAADVAAARVRPAPTGLVEAIEELLQARYQVQRFGGLVNQAVAKWHATDELPPELTRAVDLVSRILPRLEEAAAAVRTAQGGGPRRATLASGPGSARRPPTEPASPRGERAAVDALGVVAQ